MKKFIFDKAKCIIEEVAGEFLDVSRHGSPSICFVTTNGIQENWYMEEEVFDTYEEAKEFAILSLGKMIDFQRDALLKTIENYSKEIGKLNGILWKLK